MIVKDVKVCTQQTMSNRMPVSSEFGKMSNANNDVVVSEKCCYAGDPGSILGRVDDR